MNDQYNFFQWIKPFLRYWFEVIYLLVITSIFAVTVHTGYFDNNEPKIISQTVDLAPLQQQIVNLELKIEQQSLEIKQLSAANESLSSNVKILERRSQAQLEYSKRICEYILVITVDKKIIPRQCLPEYKWHKEEGQ